jgi:hypothetical protein
VEEWKSGKVKTGDGMKAGEFHLGKASLCLWKAAMSHVSPFHFSTLSLHLSTQVHKYLWIAVNNLCIKALRGLMVDKDGFSCAVIHKLSTFTTALQRRSEYEEKKILDRLSPYPQSLLLTLNNKISL